MSGAQGKAWCWHAEDFADGESTHEQFAIRFKTEEIANDFKKVIGGLVFSYDIPKDDDVVFLYEELPSDDLIMEAKKWKLPKCFYLHLEKPACSGCIGCDLNDFSFETIGMKG